MTDFNDPRSIAEELITLYHWLDEDTSEKNVRIFRKRISELESRLDGNPPNFHWFR